MEETLRTVITIETTVCRPVDIVWRSWTEPEHITQWNQASDDWHTPFAQNDLRLGGNFLSRMEAKDGSFGFDFGGIYDDVKTNERIEYTMSDGRKVTVTFNAHDRETTVIETFDAEIENSIELQRQGWQNILDNFKKYTESRF